jgi:hypothetical protein
MSSLRGAAAGYRQRRVDIRQQIKQQQEISSFLAKSYVDGAREDFGDVSIQTQRHAFIAIVIRYTTVDDDVGSAALCRH